MVPSSRLLQQCRLQVVPLKASTWRNQMDSNNHVANG